MAAILDLHLWPSAEPLLLCNKACTPDAVHCLQTHQGSRVRWVDLDTGQHVGIVLTSPVFAWCSERLRGVCQMAVQLSLMSVTNLYGKGK